MSTKRINYALAETYGVFGQYALDLTVSLEKQQYTRSAILIYKTCLARLGQLAGERNLSIADINEVVIGDLAASIERYKGVKITPAFIAKRFVRTLADQGLCKPLPPPSPQKVVSANLRQEFEPICVVKGGSPHPVSTIAGGLPLVSSSSALALRSPTRVLLRPMMSPNSCSIWSHVGDSPTAIKPRRRIYEISSGTYSKQERPRPTWPTLCPA